MNINGKRLMLHEALASDILSARGFNIRVLHDEFLLKLFVLTIDFKRTLSGRTRIWHEKQRLEDRSTILISLENDRSLEQYNIR